MIRTGLIAINALVLCAACAAPRADLPAVFAKVETPPVASRDDAADDPAIWVNAEDPAASLILGTDKQRGLYVYDLTGQERQFVPTGAINNVDLRQGVSIGDWTGDIAVASNRSDNSIAIYEISAGVVRETGSFASERIEPYGICLGVVADNPTAFVTHKTGDLIAYQVNGLNSGAKIAHLKLETQLEGCVFDDENATLFIGEEERGIWKARFSGSEFSAPQLIDDMNSASGLKADVEGLALYRRPNGAHYLLASSQGNNSFAIYDSADGKFLARFVIANDSEIDGAEETDGIDAVAAPLGPDFPMGILVVQDGINLPWGQAQNFKIVDWRDVQRIIDQPSVGEPNE